MLPRGHPAKDAESAEITGREQRGSKNPHISSVFSAVSSAIARTPQSETLIDVRFGMTGKMRALAADRLAPPALLGAGSAYPGVRAIARLQVAEAARGGRWVEDHHTPWCGAFG